MMEHCFKSSGKVTAQDDTKFQFSVLNKKIMQEINSQWNGWQEGDHKNIKEVVSWQTL